MGKSVASMVKKRQGLLPLSVQYLCASCTWVYTSATTPARVTVCMLARGNVPLQQLQLVSLQKLAAFSRPVCIFNTSGTAANKDDYIVVFSSCSRTHTHTHIHTHTHMHRPRVAHLGSVVETLSRTRAVQQAGSKQKWCR